jgi:HAD superfamily hydrolase (TIGR01509 family)
VAIKCVIFDLDGTLVDSEGLCSQAFLDLLPQLADTRQTLARRYRGLRLSHIMSDLEGRIGERLPSTFETVYRRRVSELFRAQLRPIDGVINMLEGLSTPKCIASSGPRSKIEEALMISGLSKFFDDRVFSSYEVGSWKPDPGLLLHAASAMGFPPIQCAVVEDSAVGVRAALAAGMTAFHYQTDVDAKLVDGAISFAGMSRLRGLLELAG